MNTPNDGGPAFPHIARLVRQNPVTGEVYSEPLTSEGMTLRDYFAAAALQGVILRPKPLVRNIDGLSIDTPLLVAEYCYVQADAMLAARERKETE